MKRFAFVIGLAFLFSHNAFANEKQLEKVLKDAELLKWSSIEKSINDLEKEQISAFKNEKSLTAKYNILEKMIHYSTGDFNKFLTKNLINKEMDFILKKTKQKEEKVNDNMSLSINVKRDNENLLMTYSFTAKKLENKEALIKSLGNIQKLVPNVQCQDLVGRLWVRSGKQTTITTLLNNEKIETSVLNEKKVCDGIEPNYARFFD